MDCSGRVLTVNRAHAIAYRAPTTGSGRSKQSRGNVIVRLDVTGADGRKLCGLGECQPRGGETGDRGVSWDFLLECLERLDGRSLGCADRETAVASVRAVLAEFRASADAAVPPRPRLSVRKTIRRWARRLAGRVGRFDDPRPFSGTLVGVETALLDVAARELDLSVAEMLGVHTGKVPSVVPLRGTTDVDANVELLIQAAAGRTGSGDDEPLWLDLGGALLPPAATELVHKVVEAMSARQLPPQVILEEPMGKRHLRRLPGLQRRANRAVAASQVSGLEVRIMAGNSVWTPKALDRLMARGGCGGFNIRVAALGGLLPSIELTEAVLRARPDTRIHLSSMDGAGDISVAALANLAVALPRADAVHAPEDVDQVTTPSGPGLGLNLPYESMVDRITEHVAFPPSAPFDHVGQPLNVYAEVPYLQPLGPNGTKGHLLEREALSLGLSTLRFSKGAFVASDGVHDPMLFKWSRSPLSSAVSLALCTHKEATRMRLHRAGVPVPRGRTFVTGDFAAGRAFAERIGYPVVVKPAMGVRGIGVVANIQNQQELDLAFRQLEESKLGSQDFIVEKHVSGKDYRIVVVGDEVIAAILREPASVICDGQHSIAELLMRKNLVRRLNPHLWGRPIKYDDAARYQLGRAGLTLRSVPPAGQQVLLSNSCSLSQGGDSIDVLDELHPSIKDACVRAVEAVPGLAFCGVDFLLEDHTRPIEEQQAGVCELNAHAAIGNCEYPLYGQPRQVARTFIQECVRSFDLDVHSEPAENLALRLTIKGKVTRVGYRMWMRKRAESFGVRGWIRNVNRRTVEAVLIGPTAPTSALAAAAVLGPKGALPTSVTTNHIQPPDVSGFQLVRHAPEELAYVR